MDFRRFREKYKQPWFQTAIDIFGLDYSRWDSKIADEILIRLESENSERLAFWRDFQSYLAGEREQKLEAIKDALWSSRSDEFIFENASRIVDAEYADKPLSSLGSILRRPGGRFNFGGISSFHTDFEALYLGDNYDTAFHEKYRRELNETIENENSTLYPQDLALDEVNGFTHFKVRIHLNNVLDLRHPKTLLNFVDVISTIPATEAYRVKAEKVGIRLGMVTDLTTLNTWVAEPYYTQWATWIDQPSISQWIGHYARLSGLSGIIYPSIRKDGGTNCAVFPCNLNATNSFLETVGIYHGVSEENRSLNYEAKIRAEQSTLL